MLDSAEQIQARAPSASVLILAKSNASVAAISQAARQRLKNLGIVGGSEATFTVATPSGYPKPTNNLPVQAFLRPSPAEVVIEVVVAAQKL